jgi:hypothetical protein
VDVDTEQAWEKKGRSRTKTSQFNDSPELRLALEEALAFREVQAVILDEAQHLMKVGSGRGAGKLLDQLDWIKSMTNVTGVLHILIGTYELLNFQNLSGQASRRGLEIHFPRYLFQHEQDRLDFQGVLLALLKQVPLDTREQLWRLLQMEKVDSSMTKGETVKVTSKSEDLNTETKASTSKTTSKPTKTTRKKRTTKVETSEEKNSEIKTVPEEATSNTAKTTRKKRSTNVKSQIPTQEIETKEETISPESQTLKKTRVGQRKPKRDPVG